MIKVKAQEGNTPVVDGIAKKAPILCETFLEKVLNTVSHGIGILLGISALVILTCLSAEQHSPLKVVTTSIYGATVVLMFTASTLYHAFSWPHAKAFFKIIDHSSIYLLIAGSYTPIVLVDIGSAWGWSIFGIVWGLALFGVIFKFFYTGRYEIFSLSLYGIMGWLIIIAYYPLVHSLPEAGVIWLLTGGLFYTFGIIFYVVDAKYPYAHFIWHLMVLAGCICHFFAILLYVVY